MAKRDYYEVLGISKNADEKMIKQAYRKLAKKYHPDTNHGNPQAEEQFKEVTEAYNVLNDKEKRKLYDQFGFAAFDGSMGSGDAAQGTGGPFEYGGFGNGGFGSGGFGNGGSYHEYHFNGGDMDDILKNIFGRDFEENSGFEGSTGFGGNTGGFRRSAGGFGDSSGFGFGNSSYKRKGQNATAKITIPFEDAVYGGDKVIRFRNDDGSEQSLQVHIPAGIDTGKKIRLKGKGGMGANGGAPGDLLLEVTVLEKDGIIRKGNDIYTTIQIPYTTAVFGGEAVVQTLYGNVSCKIKEGTQSGSKIRLRGKGMPLMNHPSEKGDQYATVEILVPKYLNPDAKEKLRAYQRAVSA